MCCFNRGFSHTCTPVHQRKTFYSPHVSRALIYFSFEEPLGQKEANHDMNMPRDQSICLTVCVLFPSSLTYGVGFAGLSVSIYFSVQEACASQSDRRAPFGNRTTPRRQKEWAGAGTGGGTRPEAVIRSGHSGYHKLQDRHGGGQHHEGETFHLSMDVDRDPPPRAIHALRHGPAGSGYSQGCFGQRE